jgi:hypothetical protein
MQDSRGTADGGKSREVEKWKSREVEVKSDEVDK